MHVGVAIVQSTALVAKHGLFGEDARTLIQGCEKVKHLDHRKTLAITKLFLLESSVHDNQINADANSVAAPVSFEGNLSFK